MKPLRYIKHLGTPFGFGHNKDEERECDSSLRHGRTKGWIPHIRITMTWVPNNNQGANIGCPWRVGTTAQVTMCKQEGLMPQLRGIEPKT